MRKLVNQQYYHILTYFTVKQLNKTSAATNVSSWKKIPPSCHSKHFLEQQTGLHCKEIKIYVFLEKELHGLRPDFHIHVSVSDQYIPMICPPIFLQQNRQTDQRNICRNRSQNHECRKWVCSRAVPFLGNLFRIFGIESLQCGEHIKNLTC